MAHFDLCVLDADRARHGVNRATVLSLARALAGRAVPVIYQLNKTDLPGAWTAAESRGVLALTPETPLFEARAIDGTGMSQTFLMPCA